MTYKALCLLLVSTLLLNGCASVSGLYDKTFKKDEESDTKMVSGLDPNCPQVGLMPGLSSITQIRDDKVVSETIFTELTSTCALDTTMATVRLNIGFKGRLGTLGLEDAKVSANYTLPYLIAVLDKDGAIISKEVFAINLTYKDGLTEQALTDIIEQIIPLKDTADAKNYKIMLGFQLNELELAYNKINKK